MSGEMQIGGVVSPHGGPTAHQKADGGVRAPINRRQLAWITLGAVAIFAGMRLLPTGTNLSHMDFRATGSNSIEFCDPLNPQFISVVSARSPVTMIITRDEFSGGDASRPASYEVGHAVRGVVTLKTGSGKPIAPEDLLVTHTRKLHLLIVDPSLRDYQHVHPQPGKAPGQWTFSFTPRLAGQYRVFADFTPVATARGLYANADLEVVSALGEGQIQIPEPFVGTGEGNIVAVEREGFRFSLAATPEPIRAGQPLDLSFAVRRSEGGAVPMQPVMGAFAHLVAFDESRSGFAHLHPVDVDPLKAPDPLLPVLKFKLTIPREGRYVVWAQVNLGGHEVFVPFRFEVFSATGGKQN